MAKVVYKSYNQNDNLLFPHCIGDFIPENDPVRVLDAIVEHLDISAIEATYKGGGASSFAPRMLLKVILIFIATALLLKHIEGSLGRQGFLCFHGL